MSMTPEEAQWFATTVEAIVANVGKAVLGKEHVIRLAVTCLLTEGHLLLEDYPGTGKTSLAKSLANTVQGTHKRIQFTPDLLPGDVTGVTVYDQRSMQFDFHEGPIFASLVLADEINRASPSTASNTTSAPRSWSSRPRTPSSRPARTGCRRRSSTGSS
jgi:MoxR-like ATPase